ncbi:MAG: 50S ribosome-binding GTPase [Anaerolineales bacterium]|nr:50S ribosome-binding GTPase [Anaerolineales bacterium]
MLQNQTEKEREVKAVLNGLRLFSRFSKAGNKKLLNSISGTSVGDVVNDIANEIQEAIENPPQIVLIGKTGVGKSSTINKLFDPKPNLPIDHVEPATVSIEVLTLSLGERGDLIIVDCPGLGDSSQADKRNMLAFKELLAQSDVAVWILKADDKTLGIDISFVKKILPKNLKDRLVIGINQIDNMQPGEWNTEFNIPSKEQDESIKRKEEVVRTKFNEIGIEPFSIVSYSAKRDYHLIKLFRSLVDACPQERVPALVSRKAEIKSFFSGKEDKKSKK